MNLSYFRLSNTLYKFVYQNDKPKRYGEFYLEFNELKQTAEIKSKGTATYDFDVLMGLIECFGNPTILCQSCKKEIREEDVKKDL